MEGMEEKLGAILGNPQLMQQIPIPQMLSNTCTPIPPAKSFLLPTISAWLGVPDRQSSAMLKAA